MVIKPDAPDRYVVVHGDTLWGIAKRFTDSPWRWPELWHMNKEQIKNPQLIYPGNVIVLDRARASLALSGTVKLSPHVRVERLEKGPIPSIPASVIEPFLERPMVIEPDGLENAPTIVATQGDKVIVATGDVAYARGVGDSKEQDWYIYRKGKALVDPDTDKTLGYEAESLGTAHITRAGDPSTIEITSAVQEITRGDKLVPVGKPQSVSYVPHAPSTQITGRVIATYGGISRIGESGQGAVITINRGKADGVEMGNVLALYRHGVVVADVTKPKGAPGIHVPEERYGLIFVFRVFQHVSYALVMGTTRPVDDLDVVRNP